MAEGRVAIAAIGFVATHNGTRRQRDGKQLPLDDYAQWCQYC